MIGIFSTRSVRALRTIENQQINLFTGNYSQFETLRAEQLAQQQAMHIRQQKEIKHIQSYVDRFRYKASKARQAQSRIKMLERMQRNRTRARGFNRFAFISSSLKSNRSIYWA